MKIALLAPLEHPLAEPYAGGLERHTVQLARGLAGRGHRVTLFARPGSAEITGVRLVAGLSYLRVLRKVRAGSFDLIHNNSLSWVPTLSCVLLRVPLVTTLHTPPYRRLRPGAWMAEWTGRGKFIAISAVVARQWRPVVRKSVVVHNGIDPARFPFSATGRGKTAVWVGRISPEKGTHHAILAAGMAGFHLTIIGPIYDADYYSSKVAPLLGDKVVYRGALSRRELLPHISSASVALFTSLWEEPFGLVLLEYLSCGTPVAAYGSGAAREILNGRVSAMAPTGDVERLSHCITHAASCVRAHCREHVRVHFPLSRMVEAYEDCYRTFAGLPP